MVKIFILNLLLPLVILLGYKGSYAQHVDLNNIALNDIKRVESLLDTQNYKSSYTIRNSTLFQDFEKTSWKKFKITGFGLMYQHQDNSDLPFGYNDGNMVSSVGAQHLYTTQLNVQWGRLTLQFAPEKVIADNKSFERLPYNYDGSQSGDAFWRRYYEISENIIENPARIETSISDHNYLGQSSLKFNTKNISIGVSSENLWWGPGIYNSLILTNNAQGFLHFTINTHKPIATKIGNFEGQIIGGNLINANIPPTNNDNPFAAQFNIAKPDLDRYLTGMIITYEPKITPNFFLGIANMAYMYKKDMNGLEDITPLTNFTKFTELKKRPSLGSVFFRYAMPKDHAEIYLEYGRNDRGATPINIFSDSIPTGYVGGIRKLFPLGQNGKRGAIAFNIEVTRLELMNPNQIFNYSLTAKRKSWYTNTQVPQGYTNNGQIIGSYVGPGSNSQTIQLSWVKGLKKLGFGIERVSHNKDFYYYNYYNGLKYPGPNFKYWADLIYNISLRWTIGDVIISADYKSAESYNYMWTKTGTGGLWGPSDTDKKNIQINLSVKYLISRKF